MARFYSMTRLELTQEQQHFVTRFFDTYVQLNEEEEIVLKEETKKLAPKEADMVFEMMNSYERRGMEKGIQEGRQEGLQEAAKRMLAEGMDVALIVKLTKLPEAEVRALALE